jgi:hypothetical protein
MAKKQRHDSEQERAVTGGDQVEETFEALKTHVPLTVPAKDLRVGHRIVSTVSREGRVLKSKRIRSIEFHRSCKGYHIDGGCYDMFGVGVEIVGVEHYGELVPVYS